MVTKKGKKGAKMEIVSMSISRLTRGFKKAEEKRYFIGFIYIERNLRDDSEIRLRQKYPLWVTPAIF